ncbi:hypothetical protein [Acinetobacter soli]|uniref:hypothetical protein n=1 Tax=Acinetobacter soli TaxID=487316 RepID=UPI001D0AC381|nr:hypothetical protein [Acinetobacter soli]MCB8770167.1 hypothetical protein [Acinetobacter soli]
MNEEQILLKDFLENKPLYSEVSMKKDFPMYNTTSVNFREMVYFCDICESIKPLHNDCDDYNFFSIAYTDKQTMIFRRFSCVSCQKFYKEFLIRLVKVDGKSCTLMKVGEYPQKQLPKSKTLSKFFREDKAEYNKAVICIANGYGVAAFAYMRRIVEKNILSLLDQIQESVSQDSAISNSINELKATSPMSDRIRIANSALPDYLKPDGFNPLGQIYGLLSDGVHSLSDSECLDKAENIQVCLEFLISELAAHKQNKEEFKKRLDALRK